MRWLRVAVGVGALGVLVAQVANADVPAFVRQTGLVCNQCHMTWTPNPDMTFTGTKFRMNGYRTPWVAEKIEAGEEGALNGRRLVLGIDGYLSYHMRSLLATQAKPASDPALAEASAGPWTTRPFQSLAWDFTGPITENIGIWTEWYSTQQQNALPNNGAVANQFGVVDNDEYDVKMVFNPGDGGNIINFGINNQNLQNPFFGAFNNGAPRSGLGNTVNLSASAWLKDRVALTLAIVPGQNEQDIGGWDYKRMNYGLAAAVLPMNTDAMWLMVTGFALLGNDQDPQSNIPGISALRTDKPGASYTSYDLGDSKRFAFDVRFGALDKGHWSWNTATGINVSTETYSDGAEFNVKSFGTNWRIFYERTYGLLLGLNKYMSFSYTEANGTVHDIPNDWNPSVSLVFRQAMNFAWELEYNINQSLRLDQNWRNGRTINLRWHFLY